MSGYKIHLAMAALDHKAINKAVQAGFRSALQAFRERGGKLDGDAVGDGEGKRGGAAQNGEEVAQVSGDLVDELGGQALIREPGPDVAL